LQLAVIEMAQNVLGLVGANSTEFNVLSPHPVIGMVSEWIDASGQAQSRTKDSQLGGTLRLGAQTVELQSGSMIAQIYQRDLISERHRHRYEVNEHYVLDLAKHGLMVTGRSQDKQLVETVERQDHPWFVACQFHPEFKSKPGQPHPLFGAFVNAALLRAKAHSSKGDV